MKSFESSQAENKTYSIHVEGSLRGSEKVPGEPGSRGPGEGTFSNVFNFLGEEKLNRGREKRFHPPPTHTHTHGNVNTFSS